MSMRGLIVAAPRSGSGKTTLTLGLMRALCRRGLAVAGLKCGPDYIDPAFHAAATGRQSYNLDSWAMPPAMMETLAMQASDSADLIVCEGLMGLFDGVPGIAGRSGATADIAAAFGWPILLLLDVSGQSQTAGALALGCARFDPRVQIGGVVMNRVGSDRHRHLASAAIAQAGLPVLGALPRSTDIVLPERHLGLVQAGETEDLDSTLEKLADFIEAHVDLDKIVAMASASARDLQPGDVAIKPPGQRIAIARDAAFSFLYPHILASWRSAGAELSFFSPLADEAPPEFCDVCWLPGGYPELHAGPLAQAVNFLAGTRRFAATRPVHGECGGYMVLGRSLIDASGIRHDMLGLLDLVTSFATRRLTLGYREARLIGDGVLGAEGACYRGHEFHYATIAEPGQDAAFAEVIDAYGSPPKFSGSRRGHVTGSFFHVIAPA
ncbi:MAG: cobyrinate a,c-diamide synthase [Pseudomonadota bacterium]